ncbi:DUF6528 family protein [Phytohabitans aurantiacus]|jgi:hypothetical protein|uniref:Uncharacterized protein n=1 Tax=Phytohabitans aurantiacus TaxID=3016789 RepID=A0ABQ5QR27_9ACTN|nr:DUF6528 family protein [Phytohabitans aurantiacus]GLH96427.1 hypothetical protein Pa4123_17010 [Phytohabitans aurantiacus]
MQRRTILRGLAAGTVAGPAAAILGPGAARAASDYHVVTTEQVSNRLLTFNKYAPFTDANVLWSFSPGGGGWSNLSDVKLRNTAHHGWIALATASSGQAGIINIGGDTHTNLSHLMWSATPGGNPHAIERIPNNGSVVVASSHGYLTVYAPSAISDPGTLAAVQTESLPGAHGVLWDPTYELLWAIGQDTLRGYAVEGTYRNTRIRHYGVTVGLGAGNLGHDLQPDYSNNQRLLCTATDGVYEINTAGGTFSKVKISSETLVKSYVRHWDGEAISVRADDVGSRVWGSPTVRFSASPDQTRSGAEFYKARIWAVNLE